MRLQFWDTNGQEKYKSISPIYARDADAAIFIFDMGSVASFVELL